MNFEAEPVSVVTPAALLIDVEAPALPFDPTTPALEADATVESAKDAEGISACAAAKRPVTLPLTISVKFGPLISSEVSFKTSVTSPAWKTVEFSPSLRAGGRQKPVVAGHCLTSPWWLETTPHGHVWSAAPLKGGWR